MSKHYIFGIRHHGPGSARAVLHALIKVKPDMILVEGPPDGNNMIPWLAHPEMELPAALLVYRPDLPHRAAYYPFTTFSPEYQALMYALKNDVAVAFADLPQSNLLATDSKPQLPSADPLINMAKAAGFRSYEEWWNLTIEQRLNSEEVFNSILLLMRTMREAASDLQSPEADDESRLLAKRREAMMRHAVRDAIKKGKQRIAFVCGAWHAPALVDLDQEAEDEKLLSDLPHTAVESTWVPWTYGRLSFTTGYGAGILSPGWYHHLWARGQQGSKPQEIAVSWLSRVAALLRDQGLAASSAHVIQAVRLAEALAAMRDLPYPGLPELNDATITVLCSGDVEPMKLIQHKLIVSERLGMVPADTPMIPLQRDLIQQQKRLQMAPKAEATSLNLNLRKAINLERSQLLHRLNLLQVPWGQQKQIRSLQGSSQEMWQLLWKPDFTLRIIEASIWGNTVSEAASDFAQDQAQQAKDLAALTNLLDKAILADLPAAITAIMTRIGEETAISSDIPHMMAALPPLARVLRYGSVRQTDKRILTQVVDGLMTRICIGLPSTCASLDDAAAAEMSDRFTDVNGVIHTLRDQDHTLLWSGTMRQLVDLQNLHGLLAGRACRYLLDESVFQINEAVQRLEQALQRGASSQLSIEEAIQSAAWLEGFFHGSELLLIHDRQLWQLLDGWVSRLGEKRFIEMLPLLRKTFSGLSQAARQQIHDRVRYEIQAVPAKTLSMVEFDYEQANETLPFIGQLLGIDLKTNGK